MPFQRARAAGRHTDRSPRSSSDSRDGDASLQVARKIRPARSTCSRPRREVVFGGGHAQAPANSRQGLAGLPRPPSSAAATSLAARRPPRCAARAPPARSRRCLASSREIRNHPRSLEERRRFRRRKKSQAARARSRNLRCCGPVTGLLVPHEQRAWQEIASRLPLPT